MTDTIFGLNVCPKFCPLIWTRQDLYRNQPPGGDRDILWAIMCMFFIQSTIFKRFLSIQRETSASHCPPLATEGQTPCNKLYIIFVSHHFYLSLCVFNPSAASHNLYQPPSTRRKGIISQEIFLTVTLYYHMNFVTSVCSDLGRLQALFEQHHFL